MKKRYIVCFDGLTGDQSAQAVDLFRELGLGWWRWVGDAWFLSDLKGKYSAKDIRNEVKKIVPNERLVVIEINEDGDTWAGVKARDPENKMFTWFRKYWK